MKKYHILRIRVIKQNGHFEVVSNMACDIFVTDLEKYRLHLKHQHDCSHVHLTYEEYE
jgi:hypothetical protein